MIHQRLAEWSQWFWPFFANHMWQTTLLALLAWGMTVMFRRLPAQRRHLIWLLAFAKFLAPLALLTAAMQASGMDFLLPADTRQKSIEAAAVFFEPILTAGQPEPLQSHKEIFCLLTLLWGTGAAFLFAGWLIRKRRLKQWIAASREMAGEWEQAIFDEARARLKLPATVSLALISENAGPFVWGMRKPIVVLPKGLVASLCERELDAILLHELVHVQRKDNLFGNLRMLLSSLFWFHPMIWFLDRKLGEECEVISDEQVLAAGAAPDDYATGLWKAVQFGLGWPVAGVSRAAGTNLKWRIEHMLRKPQSQTSYVHRLSSGLAIAILFFAASAMIIVNRNLVSAQETQNAEKQEQKSEEKGNADVRPKILYQEKAEYTKEGRDNKVEGTVLLSTLFQADGKLSGIRVIRGLPDGLTEKAIEAAKKIRFEPAKKDGEPVSVRVTLEYLFKLE